jgi:ribosomal protein L14
VALERIMSLGDNAGAGDLQCRRVGQMTTRGQVAKMGENGWVSHRALGLQTVGRGRVVSWPLFRKGHDGERETGWERYASLHLGKGPRDHHEQTCLESIAKGM